MTSFTQLPISRAAARRFALGCLCGFFSLSAWSGSINASAVDKSGAMLEDVVVQAMPVGARVPPAVTSETLTIAQKDMQFSPYVTVIRQGAQIKFPNLDNMEHHVKSFSPAKEFELKIHDKGTPPPVVFDKTGTVIVYCLLHDWMRAYVQVVDTPYFGKTDANGKVSLDGLPDGTYEIQAWHPDLGRIKPALQQTVKVAGGAALAVKFDFDFTPRKRRAGRRLAN